ncbi:GNAT family N-acetyltransferase [Streptomyces sp. NBC_00536]|uniref:GNAT family N-acetyltransferase n=1 Tax=Streptomyces sp. NBC_00536 TaxID=2975769 RepID=UPI002E81B051|nr:GNAT family N-acetyltransferase [Streptomyces sp. NBC_00536]WUC80943.1 GNAT family N-acetyltransferase [Streptomyces sp. NBC_00536]
MTEPLHGSAEAYGPAAGSGPAPAPVVPLLSVPPTVAELGAWTRLLGAVYAADLPAVPAPSLVEVTGRLGVPSIRGRSVQWAIAGADGEIDGAAALLLFTDEGNTHGAYLDVLAVRPSARRRGLGRALWEAVRAELLAQGRTSVSSSVEPGTPAGQFATGLGFENVLPMGWHVQRVPAGPVEEPEVPAGYRLVSWSGETPDAWAEASAVAHGAMEDAPMGDLDERAPTWTGERVRSAQRLVVDRGGVILSVAALTDSGEMAAYTELVFADPADTRAMQYDTVVVPAHRGRGLGRLVKRRMLADAVAAYPELREIATTVADENAPMIAVNEALGYRRERDVALFQLKL